MVLNIAHAQLHMYTNIMYKFQSSMCKTVGEKLQTKLCPRTDRQPLRFQYTPPLRCGGGGIMTIVYTWKEYWPSRGSNQRPPVLKSATLPTKLWDSARSYRSKHVLNIRQKTKVHIESICRRQLILSQLSVVSCFLMGRKYRGRKKCRSGHAEYSE